MAAAIHLGYAKADGSPSVPHSWQNRFHGSPARLRWLEGAVQSGKTTSGVLEGRIHSWETPNNFGLVCRETMPLLKDTVLPEWLDQIDDRVHFNKGNMSLEYPNGSVVLFRGLVSSRGQRLARKFGSYKLGWFHIEEGDVLRQEELLLLLPRLNRPNCKRYQGWITMNGVNPAHWITKFRQQPGTPQETFKSDTYGNRENLPPGFIETLEAFYGAKWTARYLRGESVFLGEGSAMYETYSSTVHGIPHPFLEEKEEEEFFVDEEGRDRYRTLIHERPVLRGWDYGYLHPAVLFGQNDVSDRLMWQNEFMGTVMTTDELAQMGLYLSNEREKGELPSKLQRLIYTRQLEPFYPKGTRFADYCDPAGKSKNIQTGKSDIAVLNSYKIFPLSRASQISEGVGIIRHLLNVRTDGTPGMYVDTKRCPILSDGFAGGYKKAKRGEMILDEPEKDGYYEHLQDCARYVALHTHKAFGEGTLKKARRRDKIIQSTLIGGVKV